MPIGLDRFSTQCTDAARCRLSENGQASTDSRHTYGIREVEVIGYDSASMPMFGSTSVIIRFMPLVSMFIVLTSSP